MTSSNFNEIRSAEDVQHKKYFGNRFSLKCKQDNISLVVYQSKPPFPIILLHWGLLWRAGDGFLFNEAAYEFLKCELLSMDNTSLTDRSGQFQTGLELLKFFEEGDPFAWR